MISSRYKFDQKPTISLNVLQKLMLQDIQLKIDQDIYQFEYITCCICSKNDFLLLSEKDRYGLYCPIVICKNCGLVQTNPRMTQSSYNDFYNTAYRKLYGGKQTASKEFFRNQYKQGKSIYKYILSKNIVFPQKRSLVLEVGCGAGGILQVFREKGFVVKGIDIGEEYINFGKTYYNLDLLNCALSDLRLKEYPDLIIYSHVLEHILDLNQELQLIKKLCKPSTKIYIEVPGLLNVHNAYKMDFLKYFQNAHTYHFSLATLQEIFILNGYNALYGNEYIRSIFELKTAINNKKISNNFEKTIRYINFVENNRYLAGFFSAKNFIMEKYFALINKIKRNIK